MMGYETSVLSLRDRVLQELVQKFQTKKRKKKESPSALGAYFLNELCSVRNKESVAELGTDDVIFMSHAL